MSKPDLPAESEHELRWRLWREKCQRSDRIADRRMKIVFWAVVAIMVAMILYVYFRPNAFSEGTEPTVARVQFAIGRSQTFLNPLLPQSE